MTVCVLMSVVLALAGGVGSEPWYASYESGLELIKIGDYDAGYAALQDALASRPEEGLQVRTYGMRYVDYLPHLHLAVAAYHLHDAAGARAHLADAEASGVAERSPAGAPLLDRYRELVAHIGEGTRSATADSSLATLRASRRQPLVLSQAEVKELKRQTLIRCGLASGAPASSAPWYFHYEMGLELAQRGDAQRAVDALMAAAESRPLPREYARMYGMWFTHYRPYIELADSHIALGNWDCAFNALTLSRETGEVAAGGSDLLSRYRTLLGEVDQHRKQE